MSGILLALCGFAGMLLLIFLRIPIAVAMAVSGFLGTAYLANTKAAIYVLRNAPYERASSYTMLIIPLFLMMGFAASRSGMSKDLFRAANAWFGHLRGGLAIAAVFSSAAFGAICGSALATAAAVCSVILPEMRRYGYSDRLATGSIAAGGTLGIMIPPSIIFVIYAIITETSPARLLLAGVVPGLIGLLLFAVTVLIWVRLDPDAAPMGVQQSWRERFESLAGLWLVILLFAIVIGGMYLGISTPAESAAFGAIGAILIGFFRRTLDLNAFLNILYQTATTTAMIFFIIIGADIFTYFISLTQMPVQLAEWLIGSGLSTTLILIGILAIYIFLGAVMDELAMLLLTLPVFFPLIVSLNVDPVWFGVMVVLMAQIGMISPPLGINVFVINGMARDVPIQSIFVGVLPFIGALLVLVAMLVVWPWLPTFILP
jgi:tripartite ATP-independent transporter DctM subunit